MGPVMLDEALDRRTTLCWVVILDRNWLGLGALAAMRSAIAKRPTEPPF